MGSIFSFFFRIAIALFITLSVTFASDLRSLWKAGFYKSHEQLAEVFRKGELTKDAIYSLHDSSGNNLAHKIFYYLKQATKKNLNDPRRIIGNYLYAIEKLHELCGDGVFEIKNDEGKTPFAASPIVFSKVFVDAGFLPHPNLVHLLIRNYEVLLNTDPDFFLMPFPNNVTPLMELALNNPEIYPDVERKLTTLGKSVDQIDRWGYTAKKWIGKKDLGANYLFALDNLNHDLSSEPLDISFWDKVERESTYDFTDHHNNRYFFDELAFNEVLLNQDRTGLKESFLQRNITTRQNEANQLWEAFFKVHDDLVVKRISRVHGGDNGYIDRIKGTPNAIRVLGRINSIEDYLCYPEGRETAQIIRSKILSTGGTFGINFKRTATSNEAKIMKDSVESFVRNVESNIWLDIAQEIMNAFFVAYSLPLEKTQQDALNSHQVNCVILGLYSVFNIHQRYSPEDPFSEIDRLVAAKKGCSASAIRSKDRYDGIAEHIDS